MDTFITQMEPSYIKDELKEGLLKLSEQTKKETMLWRNRIFKNNSVLKVLGKGKQT